MDASVAASLMKWPNVPDCYGWLHLDAQGQWRMGERAAGEPEPGRVAHAGLRGFINRNYLCPSPSPHDGAWALQNGPQRVWVSLALAPLIARFHGGVLTAHTGAELEPSALYLTDAGVMYMQTPLGAAALESASMLAFSECIVGDSHWLQSPAHAVLALQPCADDAVAQRLGFDRNPTQASG